MGNYRDDREATRRRAENLESELEATRRELAEMQEKLRAHESKDVDDERRIAELTRRLEALGESAPKTERNDGGGRVAVWLAAGMVLAGGLAAFALLTARTPAAPAMRPLPPPIPEIPPVTAPPQASKPPPERTAQVTFQARVIKASGAPVASGAPCELRAELASTGKNHAVRKVELSCGKTVLYRQGDNAGETIISMSKWDFDEARADAAGLVRYHLLFEDRGQRSSKLFQISLDTRDKRVRLWRDEPARAEADLSIDEWSAPLAAEPLLTP